MTLVLAEEARPDRPLLVKAVDALALGLAWMACAATAGIVLLLTMEMVGRGLFSHSFAFAWEYSAYALGIMIFGGLGWTLRTGGHIRVTVLENLLPGRAYWLLEWFANALAAVLASLLAVAMVAQCLSSFADQSRSFLATESLLYIPQIFISAGAVGFALQTWLRLYCFHAGQPVTLRAVQLESAQAHL